MRRRLLSLFTLLAAAATATQAVPALRQTLTARLADGTTIDVTPQGDEWHHWLQAADGRRYSATADGQLQPLAADATAAATRRAARAHTRRQQQRRGAQQPATMFHGTFRGLIILVDFPDRHFADADPQDVWLRYANDDLRLLGHPGSVHDYFLSQSYGHFDLTFDVVGPVTMSREAAWYGENDAAEQDFRVPIMLREACLAIADTTDFRPYDWDGDGKADQVFLLYAGRGENSNIYQTTLIWPHMYDITGWREDGYTDYEVFDAGGVQIDTYACSCELNRSGQHDGIGTICHEFSHCLGLPDLYDTESGWTMLGSWDLMDQGCYNGSGWCPAAYSAYERYSCGWLRYEELAGPSVVDGMMPLTADGTAYRISNDSDDPDCDEYYVLENRQRIGWDASLPGTGLLVTHVDYDAQAWDDNTPNTDPAHLRVSYISASGTAYGAGVTYPYQRNATATTLDSLTDASRPAATLFHPNSQGTYLMGKPLTDIAVDDFGRVSFTFMGGEADAIDAPHTTTDCTAAALPAYDLAGRRATANGRPHLLVEQGRKRLAGRRQKTN